MKKSKKPTTLVLKIIEYCFEKDTFTLSELNEKLRLTSKELAFLKSTLIQMQMSGVSSPNHIMRYDALQAIGNLDDDMEANVRLLPTAIFQYIDYLEVVEARKAATEARRLSWIAIGITLIIGIAQLYFSTC